MDVVTAICLTMLGGSAVLCAIALVRARSLADRVIALDTLLIVVVIVVVVAAARSQQATYLDAMLVVALVAFIGTTLVARLIEQRGAR
jgi:multisubunit Na+/H+ antiporter MnhF subunit